VEVVDVVDPVVAVEPVAFEPVVFEPVVLVEVVPEVGCGRDPVVTLGSTETVVAPVPPPPQPMSRARPNVDAIAMIVRWSDIFTRNLRIIRQ
jgi:hypothetical protein